jgi:hypothetical protein
MNEQFLRDTTSIAVERPRRVDMMTWLDMRNMGDGEYTTGGATRLYAECGAAGCLYGWGRLLKEFGSKEALLEALTRFNRPTVADVFEPDEEMEGLYNTIRDEGDQRENVARLFDISQDEADRLAIVECWPEEFYYPYMVAHWKGDAERKAGILAMRVEYFIQTDGQDEGRSTKFQSSLYYARKSALRHDNKPHRAGEDELARYCSSPLTKDEEGE